MTDDCDFSWGVEFDFALILRSRVRTVFHEFLLERACLGRVSAIAITTATIFIPIVSNSPILVIPFRYMDRRR